MLAHVLPYALFAILLTFRETIKLEPAWFTILLYAAPAVCLFIFRKRYTELNLFKASKQEWAYGVFVGLAGIAIWIAPYFLWPEFRASDNVFGWMGQPRRALDPFELSSPFLTCFYISVRSLGYILVTPMFEELFLRSFLMRFLIDANFQKVPLGAYTSFSFFATAVFFSLTHAEWIVALIYSLLLNAALVKTKSFNVCVIAHGVSNLALTAYVFSTASWALW